MSWKVVNFILERIDLPPTEKFILVRLAEVASHDGGSIYISQRRLAHETHISERCVRGKLRGFREQGVLLRERPGTGGRGGGLTDLYRLELAELHRLHPLEPWIDRWQEDIASRETPAAGAGVSGETPAADAQTPESECINTGKAAAAKPSINQGESSGARARRDGGAVASAPEGEHGVSLAEFWREKRAAVVAALGGEEGEGGRIWRAWLDGLVPLADDGEAFTLAAASTGIADYVACELAVPVAAAIGRQRVVLCVKAWVGIHLERERRRAARLEAGESGEDAA